MKSTKAYIALFMAIFLVFPGEAHMLRKDQAKLTADTSSKDSSYIEPPAPEPILIPPPEIYMPEPIEDYYYPEPEPVQTSPAEITQLGPLQVTVTWSRPGDGDLIVKTPSGKVINYTNRGPSPATDYGQLLRDVQSGLGPESIYWDASHTAPAGVYYVCLRTSSFNVDPSNPLTVTATLFSSNGNTDTRTKTFTHSSGSLDCDPSATNYIGSFTRLSGHTGTPAFDLPEPVPEVTRAANLQFVATWSREGDGDLVVRTPSGKVINYANSGPSANTDFGALQLDVRTGLGPETIYWGSIDPPQGTYDICFRTSAFSPDESDPVTATVTIVGPDGYPHTITKTFTESTTDMDCNESRASYIGSYSYQEE